MNAVEQLRKEFQDALDKADDQITVADALREIVYLLAVFTVAEDVDDREIAVLYQHSCHQMRASLGSGQTPAES